MSKFQGIYPPMVTPLTEDERIDEEGLANVINYLLNGGVQGVYLLGTTGESPALREGEWRRAVEVAKEVIDGRGGLIVGAMEPATGRCIDRLQIAEEIGVDAVAVTPPYYYPPRDEAEIVRHYERVCAAAQGPVLIYNIPSTTKVFIKAETIARLNQIDHIAGMKDSTGDWAHVQKLLLLLRGDPKFSLLIGAPTLAGVGMLLGADGAVMSVGNIDPAMTVELYKAAKAGDVERVFALQRRLDALLRLYPFASQAASIKAALHLLGLCQPHIAQPAASVAPEDYPKIEAILREMGLL
jgi:4-hydroxy-tetrahydrodipicolinate synthase